MRHRGAQLVADRFARLCIASQPHGALDIAAVVGGQQRLEAGAGTQLDVLNQQTSLLQSQTFLLQAYYSYIKGVADYDRALSLDTKFQDIFDDPLTNPQARRFYKINNPDRPQPTLPRTYRKKDPLVPILQPAPSPSPSPAKKSKPKGN